MTTHATFRALWPVTRPLTLDDAIDEASADLPRLLTTHRVRLLARPRWQLARGASIPGSGGAHTVLVCDAPAERVELAVDDDGEAA